MIRMVVVQLRGGLGNQLFQYATGRRIALTNDAPLKLDLSKLARDHLRTYKLKHFKIEAEIATPDEVMQVKGGTGVTGYLIRRLDRFKPYYRRLWVKERHFHFDPTILTISGTAFLEGYWQSEPYFKTIEKKLREELALRSKPSALSEQIARAMQGTTSVSLHVRRGDYAANPATYYLCPLEYYISALAKIKRCVENPNFFIFSDDPVWTRENLMIGAPTTFVTHNSADRDYEDLWLISQCKHHIIANSTFSWWGAWLGSHPGKTVIAPKQWAWNPKYNHKERIPEGWETL
jgi:hypothetical protein